MILITRRVATAGLLATGAFARPQDAPRRAVSIGACLDVMLLDLADRDQIVAVTHFARDSDVSTIAARARDLPFTHETVEEVMALKPDLVLASKRTALQTRTTLKAFGVRVVEFPVSESVAASLDQVRQVAALLGHAARGEALVGRIERAVAKAEPKPGERPLKALVYQSNGLVAGKGTLVGEMLERCGFENVAGRYGLKKWGNVSLEQLLADPPEVLLAGEAWAGAPTWADRTIRHPALQSLEPRTFRASFHQRLLYCGGPVLIDTAAALRKARREAQAWAARRP
ncbi:ABC transporter substrate-binding protein [Caulobacter segnis]